MSALMTERLDINAAAAVLGVTPRTLYTWRATGYGPRSIKYANKLWYQAIDCYRFIAETEATTAKGSGV